MLFLRGSGSRLGKQFLAYGFQKSNRVGSDELIACPSLSASSMSRPGSGSADDLLFVSMEKLRQQLAEKEQIIVRLRRQLQEAAASAGALANTRRTGESPSSSSLLQRVGHRLGRSTSIRSLGAWLSRRLSTTKVLPVTNSERRSGGRRRSSPLECTSNPEQALSGEPDRFYERFSYEQLMAKAAPQEDLQFSRLERHLKEDSLLEYMAICEDFLVFLDPTEVEERKYKVMLTCEQYCRL